MAAPRKYSLELRERAVRMYRTADPKPQIKKLAVDLGVSQRTVERYVKDQIRRPRADLAQCLEDAVRQRWQPRIRAQGACPSTPKPT